MGFLFTRAGHCALILAYKLRQKQCLQVLINEGQADASVIKDKSIVRFINEDDFTSTVQNNSDTRAMNPQYNTSTSSTLHFPSLVTKPSVFPNAAVNTLNQNQSKLLERGSRKSRHKTKKKLTTTDVNQHLAQHYEDHYMQPMAAASSLKFTSVPKDVATDIADGRAIRRLETNGTMLGLDRHSNRKNLLSVSDSRIFTPNYKAANILAPKHGNTKEILETIDNHTITDKSEDTSTRFAINENDKAKATCLYRFTLLPPICVSSTTNRPTSSPPSRNVNEKI